MSHFGVSSHAEEQEGEGQSQGQEKNYFIEK